MHMDNNQVRFVARSVEDPSKLGDIMPMGFGDEIILDDELAEEGEGDDHGSQWVNKEGKRDGFVSALTRAAYCRRGNHYGAYHVREWI